RAAIGFSKIKTSAFRKIKEAFPERAHLQHNEGDKEPSEQFEFYPSELVGPNSIVGQWEAIQSQLEDDSDWLGSPNFNYQDAYIRLNGLAGWSGKKSDAPSHILGEDYGFCRLARNAGLDLWLDTELLVPHEGTTDFPIPTETLQEMLKEPW